MRNLSLMMLTLMFLVTVGCGSPERGEVEGVMDQYPEWVATENNTYTDEDGSQVIYAVGSTTVGRNISMVWNTAKNDAMAQISRTLNTHVRTMFTAYAREAGDFYDEATQSSIQNNEQVTRSLSESFISGAITINKFMTKDRKEAYVLMRLDLDNKMLQTMSDRAKAAVRENFAAKVKAQTEEALAKMDAAAASLKNDLAGSPPAPAAAVAAGKK